MYGYTNANEYGFLPSADGTQNQQALQRALEQRGTVFVTEPGVYDLAGTVYIDSDTTLEFANSTAVRKVAAPQPYTHILLNRGACCKSWDSHIVVKGLQILVNGIDTLDGTVMGLRGHMGFHYVRDLHLEDIRIPDLGAGQYGIHICTFEDLVIRNVKINGDKDGIHLGRGKRFLISECVFDTFDDALALNAHDYDTGNPELGWIENGVVEKCYDLASEKITGYFCRILAGAWVDWYEGMIVQKSDTVVSAGRLYRVFADADGKTFISRTPPVHESGVRVLDDITWVMVQHDVTYTAGIRNVTFRDIFLEKPRVSFSLHFDCDRYSRSFYPNAENPMQEQLVFDHIHVLHNGGNDFISAVTPVDSISLINCSLRNNHIRFSNRAGLESAGDTVLSLDHCRSTAGMPETLIVNEVKGKTILLTVNGNVPQKLSAKA